MSEQVEVRTAITSFNSANQEFDKNLAEVDAAVQQIKEQYKELSDSWHTLDVLRRRQLVKLMAEAGLDLCSYVSYNTGHRFGSNELERLGVYPSPQMRLFYRHLYYWRSSCSSPDSTNKRVKLDIYCPEHFAQMKQRVRPSEVDPRILDIESEVIRRDGRLYTLINDIDVTQAEMEYRPYPEALYHHFDLPKLPDKPRFDSQQIR
jgi:hypothetical protein